MLAEKFPLDSDFVGSYLNFFLVNFMFSKVNYKIAEDSTVWKRCINMHQRTLNLANCPARRDSVKAFISENEAQFTRLSTAATENCKEELLEAFSADYTHEKVSKASISEINLLSLKLAEKENNLKSCIEKNLI